MQRLTVDRLLLVMDRLLLLLLFVDRMVKWSQKEHIFYSCFGTALDQCLSTGIAFNSYMGVWVSFGHHVLSFIYI